MIPGKATRQFQILRKPKASPRFARWLNAAIPKIRALNQKLEEIGLEDIGISLDSPEWLDLKAKTDLSLKDAEISSLQTGNGFPDRTGLLKFILPAAERVRKSGQPATPDDEKIKELRPVDVDQGLINAGYGPEYYRYIAKEDFGVLAVRPHGNRWNLEPLALGSEWEPGFQFLCSTPDCRVAVAGGDNPGQELRLYLIAPADDPSEPDVGDTVVLSNGKSPSFLAVKEGPTAYREKGGTASDVSTLVREPDLRLCGRVIAETTVHNKSAYRQDKVRFQRDKLRVLVAPFQDALLPYVGSDLGLFAQEGLDVVLDEKDWYSGFDDLKDGRNWLAFCNIYSFLKHFEQLQRHDISFLFAANVFNHGNAVLCDPEYWQAHFKDLDPLLAGKDRWRRVMEILSGKDLEIYLPPDSDFAVQLFETCRRFSIGMKVKDKTLVDRQLGDNAGFVWIQETPKTSKKFITDLEPEGHFHLGTLPQRMQLLQMKSEKDRWKELLRPADFGAQPQVNGFIGSSALIGTDVLPRFLHVWFKIARLVRMEVGGLTTDGMAKTRDDGKEHEKYARFLTPSWIVDRAFKEGNQTIRLRYETVVEDDVVGDMVIRQIAQAWSKELFVASPEEVRRFIIGEGTDETPLKADIDQTVRYALSRGESLAPEIESRCSDLADPASALPLEVVLREYEREYSQPSPG
jgi:hypothetical protein